MTQTPDKIVYTARASVTGGRKEGHAVSDDGILDLRLTAPKETGGPGTGTNPEQLFAAGYGACFSGAMALVGQKLDIDASQAELDVEIGFGPEGESFAITAKLTGRIPGVDDARAQELMEATHQICPYSKATRGNIPVELIGRGI